jgi:hypothetical protein
MTIPPENISAGPVAKEYLPVKEDRRFGYAGSEQAGELFGKHWSAEIVPLCFVTLVSLKKHQLFLRFHALSNDRSFRLRPMLITAVTMVVSSGAEVI